MGARRGAFSALLVGICSLAPIAGLAGPAFSGADSFNGRSLGDGSFFYCKSSTFDQTCPSGSCACLYSVGKVSGSVGAGYGRIELNEDYSLTLKCLPFNASLFAIGNKDVEQIDFSGSLCTPKQGQNFAIKGEYHIVRSASGLSGSGKVSGADDGNGGLALHFTEANKP
jgi:hypothetical protein